MTALATLDVGVEATALMSVDDRQPPSSPPSPLPPPTRPDIAAAAAPRSNCAITYRDSAVTTTDTSAVQCVTEVRRSSSDRNKVLANGFRDVEIRFSANKDLYKNVVSSRLKRDTSAT